LKKNFLGRLKKKMSGSFSNLLFLDFMINLLIGRVHGGSSKYSFSKHHEASRGNALRVQRDSTPKENYSQSDVHSQGSFRNITQIPIGTIKAPKNSPLGGCWSCGGPHFEWDYPKK
jgi:hypothetical protein